MMKVAIVMGSDSDRPIVDKAAQTLRQYGVPFEVHVYSAHRTPEVAGKFAREAAGNNIGVIIAAAGKAAHLAGAMAANTVLPVIGMDALLSTVQMPSGIPVATVAIDGAVNAALLSIQMLALSEPELMEKLQTARQEAAAAVLEKNRAIEAEYAQ